MENAATGIKEKYESLEAFYVSELHPSDFADRWFRVCRMAMSKEIRDEDLDALLDLAIVSLRFETHQNRRQATTLVSRVLGALDLSKYLQSRRMRRTLEETEKEVIGLPSRQ